MAELNFPTKPNKRAPERNVLVPSSVSAGNLSRMSKSRRILVGLSVVFMLIVLFYPYEHTVVPAARIKVVDETGKAGPNLLAIQEWFDVTVEESQHIDYARSDQAGYVTFPRRTVRASVALRVANTGWRVATQGVHASIGTSAAITVHGEPYMRGWTGYGVNGGRWPEQIQLSRWEPTGSP